MNFDYEVASKVWETHVPVEVGLEEMGNDTRPFYMMVPRCSYFPLQLQRILQYFQNQEDCPPVDPVSLVLDCNGQALKTYWPVGVLYDMFKGDKTDVLPLKLRNKRDDEQAVVSKDTLQFMFMQSVKEADYLKRKAEIVTTMRSEDYNKMWNGLVNYKFRDFWDVNKSLVESKDGKGFLHCPIRFYEKGKPFRQLPLSPRKDSGEAVLLSDALSSAFPDTDLSQRHIVCHGIDIPQETPISYLTANLCYPDNFAHVVIL